jgi:hypothetical protein
MHDLTDDQRDDTAVPDTGAADAASPPQGAETRAAAEPAPADSRGDTEAEAHAPRAEAVEEFERLAVLRMGGQDIEGALDELPEADAREVAEVAIDRVVRTYENL